MSVRVSTSDINSISQHPIQIQQQYPLVVSNPYEAQEEDGEEVWVSWEDYQKAQKDYEQALEQRNMLEAKTHWVSNLAMDP